MLLPRFAVWVLSIGPMVLGSAAVCSQNYPNKLIRIVTAGVGGGNDYAARLIAQGLTGSLDHQVIVDNRPGAFVPGGIVAKASPDGYTVLFASGSLWIGPLLESNVPYDPVRDFSPISLTNRAPNILVVHPSLPVKSVKALIALAKARPGELNYTTGAIGSSSHLAAELFRAMAGVNIVRISYKSGATETSDLIGGQVQMTFGSPGQVSPHIKSGRLRALAVTSEQPSTLFPELPTVAASGVRGYDAGATSGMFAPAKTPPTLINRLNQEIVKVLNKPDVKEKFFNRGVETVASSPDEFAAKIRSEMTRLGKVIKDAGIRGE